MSSTGPSARPVSEPALAVTAFLFLSRLPVGRWASGEPEALAAATRYFPLVGAVMALLQGLVYWLGAGWLPMPVVLLLMMVAGVMFTGAFHEDGLADVADSAGAFDRQRKLAIMRDSRIGTYGAVALILLFALRFAALWSIAEATLPRSVSFPFVQSAGAMLASLLAAHVLARWSSLWLMCRYSYARAEAANRAVADGVTPLRLLQGTLLSVLLLLPAMLWWQPSWLLLLPLALVVTDGCGRLFNRWFGGITGDCLGAANQVVEVVMLIAIGSLLS